VVNSNDPEYPANLMTLLSWDCGYGLMDRVRSPRQWSQAAM